MGNFSRDTFDKLKHYVGVRLQQGVPLVDADWNEQEDIRRYELQAFLKWFVGNGVPEGNDSFRTISIVNKIILTSKKNDDGVSSVEVNLKNSTAARILGFGQSNYLASRAAPPAAQLTGKIARSFKFNDEGLTLVVRADGRPKETVTFNEGTYTAAQVAEAINSAMSNLTASAGDGNDFDIKGGDGTAEGAGRCLVEGWDVINESDLRYSAQPLFENETLARIWGVDQVKQLTAPRHDRRDTVYLDVWEREVDAKEDKDLFNSEIGVETCVRHKLEWCVRVDEGKGYGKEESHHYYDLAEIIWDNGKIKVVKDLRTLKLTLTSVKSELEDVRQATANRWINGGVMEVDFTGDDYTFYIYKMLCIIGGQEINFGGRRHTTTVKEGENCAVVVVRATETTAPEIEFIETRKNLLEWLNSWSLDKWRPAEDTEPVLKSAFTLPLYFFERRPGQTAFKITDLRPHGVLDMWLAELDGRLDSRERRMCRVPLLQQTIFGRAVPVATVPEIKTPCGVAFDGAHIWVTNLTDRIVSKIDINTNEVVDVVVEGATRGVAFDGTHIWVAHDDKFVSKIDINTNGVVPVVVEKFPCGVAFDGTHIWVTHLGAKHVSKINIKNTNDVAFVDLREQDTSKYPNICGIVFDGTHIWVTNTSKNKVSKIDINTNEVVDVEVEPYPSGVAFDGTHIWVTHLEDKISKIDILKNGVTTVDVGKSSWGVAFDGTHIWATHLKDKIVSKIDILKNRVVATVDVGKSPWGVAFDGTHIWVANSGSNNVSKILRGDLR